MDNSNPSSPIRLSNGSIRGFKTGFWTDTGFGSKDSPLELSPAHRGRDESEEDIPLIPDIDDLQEDGYYDDIAAAPEIPSANLSSIIQLNSDLKKYAAFSVVDNINLGLLSKNLYKEADLKEQDTKWSWDLLFTEVTSELRSEWESNRENEGEK